MYFLKELIVSLGSLVKQFETQFASVATKYLEEEKQLMTNPVITAVTSGGWNVVTHPPGRLNVHHIVHKKSQLC